MFSGDAQRRSAGDHDRQASCGVDERSNLGCRREDLLEVVQDEQRSTATHESLDSVQSRFSRHLTEAQDARNRVVHETRIGDCSEWDEERSVRELVDAVHRQAQSQARLARTRRSGEGHYPGFSKQARTPRQLSRSPHEAGPLQRQLARPSLGRSAPQIELRILDEDAFLDAAEGGSWFDSQFLGEGGSGRLIGAEGICLSPGAIERQHQLLPQGLPERVLGRQRLQLLDHLAVSTEFEIGPQSVFQGGQPQLIEPHCFLPSEHVVSELSQCGTAPHAQRFCQQRACAGRVVTGQSSAAPGAQVFESRRVEFVRFEGEAVARSPAFQPGAVVAKRFADARHVHVKCVPGRFGHIAWPQILYQPVGGDHFPPGDEHTGQHSPLARGTERNQVPISEDLYLPEDSEVHTHLSLIVSLVGGPIERSASKR